MNTYVARIVVVLVALLCAARPAAADAWPPVRDTALIRAVRADREDRVIALLQEGVNVNAMGRGECTAIYWAAGIGSLNMARLLLDAGADPNILCQAEGYGRTTLMFAITEGHVEVVSLLL